MLQYSNSNFFCNPLMWTPDPFYRLHPLISILLLWTFTKAENSDAVFDSEIRNSFSDDDAALRLGRKPESFPIRSSLSERLQIDAHASGFLAKSAFERCGDADFRDLKGSIRSPGYPAWRTNVTSLVNCSWTIHVSNPSHVLTISFDDLNLRAGKCSHADRTQSGGSACCSDRLEVVRLRPIDKHDSKNLLFCGEKAESVIAHPFISTGSGVRISLSASIGGTIRGFHLTYTISPAHSVSCLPGLFRCVSGKCIPDAWRCNRKDECGDGSDEAQCSDVCSEVTDVRCDTSPDESDREPGCYSFPTDRCDQKWDCDDGSDERGCNGCPDNMFSCRNGNSCYSAVKRCDGIADCIDFSDEIECGLCSPSHVLCDSRTSVSQCYDPIRHRCNGQADCPNAIDEFGCRSCGNKILCSSGYGCYESSERCNGIPDCADYSDEKNCSSQICKADRGSFLCSNKRCIRSSWVCDRSNDCGDASDEINCLKNSIITAAIMGSLICGLLLIIAVSCTCKLIALRQVEDSEALGRSGVPIPVSDQRLLQLEPDSFFCYREPPPSYAAAVGDVPSVTFNSGDRRRMRRMRRHRRRPLSPPPPVTSHSESVTLPNANLPSEGPSQTADLFSLVVGEQSRHDQLVAHEDKTSDDETKSQSAVACDQSHDPATGPLVTIELDAIASVHSVTAYDCDQEPLLHSP